MSKSDSQTKLDDTFSGVSLCLNSLYDDVVGQLIQCPKSEIEVRHELCNLLHLLSRACDDLLVLEELRLCKPVKFMSKGGCNES